MDQAPSSHPAPGSHAHRVIFIDLARAMAVVMMIYGHTVDALLDYRFRAGWWIDAWMFQRGLTSALFLLLSGFAFSVATTRHWQAHTQLTPVVWRRLRRFAFFILIGYALHLPVNRFIALPSATPEQWRAFLAVDVLQLIGVTFIVVQLLVLFLRSRPLFSAVSLGLAIVLIFAAPLVWNTPVETRMPLWLASYLTPSTGSQFPLVPWAAYVLVGAGAGQWYSRWGASHLGAFATRVLLVPGAVLVAVMGGAYALNIDLFRFGRFNWVPWLILLRVGASFVALSLVAHLSRHLSHLPRVFGALAQESLLVYFVHLWIVYGSVWRPGLVAYYGASLTPLQTAGAAAVLLAAMILLASVWNRVKHAHPRVARWIAVAAIGSLVALLI